MTRAELKANAKKSLRGQYGNSIAVLVLFALISSIPLLIPILFENSSEETQSIVMMVSGLLSLLISALFSLGSVSFFLKVARGKKPSWEELFSKTSLWVTCLVAMIMMSIFTSLWTLLLIIPGIIASYRYRLTPYVIVDHPKIGGLEAITKSKELMRGHKMDLFVLDLSFIGWNILACLTFGLLYFWLAPYMSTTYAGFYNSLAKAKK